MNRRCRVYHKPLSIILRQKLRSFKQEFLWSIMPCPYRQRTIRRRLSKLLRTQAVADAVAINMIEAPISAVISLLLVGVSLKQYSLSALGGAVIMTLIAPIEGEWMNIVRRFMRRV